MSHSLEVKKLSIEYIKNGHSFEELKENYKISWASYYNWKKQQENGILGQKKVQKRRRKIDLKKLEQAL